MPEPLSAWLDAIGGVSLADLRRRVTWDDAASGALAPDEWLPPLATACDGDLFDRFAGVLVTHPPFAERIARAEPRHSFEELWQPIAAAALDWLVASLPDSVRAHHHADQPDRGPFRRLRDDLADDLVGRLSFVGEGALWREYNRNRSRIDIIRAHLDAGDSGPVADRLYLRFVDAHRADGLRALRACYPVLDRHLSTVLACWRDGAVELLERVKRDHAELVRHFAMPQDVVLDRVHAGLSDPHRGGRTVMRIEFARPAAPDCRYALVCKPKDLDIDAAFQALVAGAPRAGIDDPPLASVSVLPCDGYGYMGWIDHRPCSEEAELAAFYRNAGRLAALLWLLGFSDGHHENLIANGSDLLLIDAETLFEGLPVEPRAAADGAFARGAMQERIDHSVFRTGLLPQWHFGNEDRTPQDVSALGIEPPPAARERARGWIALNSDGMMLGEVEQNADTPGSLPVEPGGPNRFGEFSEVFAGGFRDQLAAIMAQRAEWLAPDGPLARFAALRRRFVPRPTWFYQWLRHELCEPDALVSETAQAMVLERLVRSYLVSDDRPATWPIVAGERMQLARLDVPFFDLAADGTALDLPDGGPIPNFLRTSGYRLCRERIAALNDDEIRFQVGLIRGAAAARAPVVRSDEAEDATKPADSADARAREVQRIGAQIVTAAIDQGDGTLGWLGREATFDLERRNFQLLGQTLYSGRCGIALFLAALHRWAPDESGAAGHCATAAIADLLHLMTNASPATQSRWWRDQPLGLAGAGGILLALLGIRALLPELGASIDHGLVRLIAALDEERLRTDDRLDIVFGGAGLIGALLAFGSPRATTLARVAGDAIVGRQAKDGAWLIPAVGARGLTGFSHGAAGIVAALARLHARTGDDRYAVAAAGGLEYERAVYDRAEGNWPDFRGIPANAPPRFALSWCHGAPGVALGRLCLAGTALWDAAVARELDDALAATVRDVRAADSVCCGRFGRAAILRLAARRTGAPWNDAATRLEHLRSGGPVFRRYTFLDDISLFTGAAGVGLALLDRARDLFAGVISANCLPASRHPASHHPD